MATCVFRRSPSISSPKTDGPTSASITMMAARPARPSQAEFVRKILDTIGRTAEFLVAG